MVPMMGAVMPRVGEVAVPAVTDAHAQSSGPELPWVRAMSSRSTPAALLMYGVSTSVFWAAWMPPTLAGLYVIVMAPLAGAIVIEVTYLLEGGTAFNAPAVAASSGAVFADAPIAVFASEASEKPSVTRARTV